MHIFTRYIIFIGLIIVASNLKGSSSNSSSSCGSSSGVLVAKMRHGSVQSTAAAGAATKLQPLSGAKLNNTALKLKRDLCRLLGIESTHQGKKKPLNTLLELPQDLLESSHEFIGRPRPVSLKMKEWHVANNGQCFLSRLSDGKIGVFDANCHELGRWQANNFNFSPNNEYMAFQHNTSKTSYDNPLCSIVSLKDGKEILQQPGNGCLLTSNNEYAVICTPARDGESDYTVFSLKDGTKQVQWRGHNLRNSSDGRYVAMRQASSPKDDFFVYSLQDNRQILHSLGEDCQFSPAGEHLLVSNKDEKSDNEYTVFSLPNGKQIGKKWKGMLAHLVGRKKTNIIKISAEDVELCSLSGETLKKWTNIKSYKLEPKCLILEINESPEDDDQDDAVSKNYLMVTLDDENKTYKLNTGAVGFSVGLQKNLYAYEVYKPSDDGDDEDRDPVSIGIAVYDLEKKEIIYKYEGSGKFQALGDNYLIVKEGDKAIINFFNINVTFAQELFLQFMDEVVDQRENAAVKLVQDTQDNALPFNHAIKVLKIVKKGKSLKWIANVFDLSLKELLKVFISFPPILQKEFIKKYNLEDVESLLKKANALWPQELSINENGSYYERHINSLDKVAWEVDQEAKSLYEDRSTSSSLSSSPSSSPASSSSSSPAVEEIFPSNLPRPISLAAALVAGNQTTLFRPSLRVTAETTVQQQYATPSPSNSPSTNNSHGSNKKRKLSQAIRGSAPSASTAASSSSSAAKAAADNSSINTSSNATSTSSSSGSTKS